MIHVLPPDPPRVDDGAEALGGALLAREPPGSREHPAQDRLVAGTGLGERRQVPFRDDHEVHWGLGSDVVEGEHVVVLVHLAAGNLARDDLAEDAVGHSMAPISRARPSRRFPSDPRAARAPPGRPRRSRPAPRAGRGSGTRGPRSRGSPAPGSPTSPRAPFRWLPRPLS